MNSTDTAVCQCKQCRSEMPLDLALFVSATVERAGVVLVHAGFHCKRCMLKLIGASPNDFPLPK